MPVASKSPAGKTKHKAKTPTGRTPNVSTPQKTGFKPRPGLRLIPPLISIPIFMILLAGGIWLFLDARDKLDKLAQPPGNNTGNPGETGENTEAEPGTGNSGESGTTPKDSEDTASPKPEDYGDTPGYKQAAQRLASMLNTKANPCDDFYEYSCGKWLKDNPVPDDAIVYGISVQVMNEVDNEMNKLLQSPAPSSSKAIEKVRLLYKSCLDRSAYESEALQQTLDLLKDYNGFPMLEGLRTDKQMPAMFDTAFLTTVLKQNLGVQLFSLDYRQDMKDSNKRILSFNPAGVPLFRDVWLDKTKFKKEWDAYRQYLKGMLTMFASDMGLTVSNNVGKQIDDLFELYTGMAKIMIPPGEDRDIAAQYNMEPFRNLVQRFKDKSGIDLMALYSNSYSSLQYRFFLADPSLMVNIPFPRVVDEIAQLIQSTSSEALINGQIIGSFLRYRSYLPEKYRDLSLELNKVIWGYKTKGPSWKACIELASELQDAYGAYYVRNHFSQETVTAVGDMVTGLKSSFNELLDEADWMDKKTRQAAKKKVKEMLVKIGYNKKTAGDKELDEIYKDLKIEPNMKFFEMHYEVLKFQWDLFFKDYFASYDRDNVFNAVATDVNAYATLTANSILFTAGYLRAPYFDRDYPAALNYGAMGQTIGHEITHHFDDGGRFYDEVGHLNDWWTPSTRKEYERKAQCMIDQYNGLNVEGLNGIKVNGKMTLGENIADNGGVREAFRAYQKYLAKNGREKLVPGYKLSNEQLFWIGYGQSWCGNGRDQWDRYIVLTDTHSPNKIRANVVVSNQPEFAKAFKCPKGSPMNPEKKCSVW